LFVSFAGMVRVVPHFLYLFHSRGHHDVVCGAPEPMYGNAAVGFWVQAFVLSKLFELIDTAFIVLRKRPLNFLHWYHHVTVLLFTWFCYVYENPGITFIAMNYSVHAVMYGESLPPPQSKGKKGRCLTCLGACGVCGGTGYYYLMAVQMRPSWLKPQFITVMQISQVMVATLLWALNKWAVR
jgi:hypothetical protein